MPQTPARVPQPVPPYPRAVLCASALQGGRESSAKNVSFDIF